MATGSTSTHQARCGLPTTPRRATRPPQGCTSRTGTAPLGAPRRSLPRPRSPKTHTATSSTRSTSRGPITWPPTTKASATSPTRPGHGPSPTTSKGPCPTTTAAWPSLSRHPATPTWPGTTSTTTTSSTPGRSPARGTPTSSMTSTTTTASTGGSTSRSTPRATRASTRRSIRSTGIP